MFYFSRQFEPSLAQCRKTIELDPNFFASHFVCGLALEQMGQHEEVLAEFQAAVDLSGRLPLFLAALGHGYALAAIYAGLGQTDQALEWLERACDERATWMIFLKVHPYFDNLHSEPRFQELLKRFQFVGLNPKPVSRPQAS